jgi:hypothetical protein
LARACSTASESDLCVSARDESRGIRLPVVSRVELQRKFLRVEGRVKFMQMVDEFNETQVPSLSAAELSGAITGDNLRKLGRFMHPDAGLNANNHLAVNGDAYS